MLEGAFGHLGDCFQVALKLQQGVVVEHRSEIGWLGLRCLCGLRSGIGFEVSSGRELRLALVGFASPEVVVGADLFHGREVGCRFGLDSEGNRSGPWRLESGT